MGAGKGYLLVALGASIWGTASLQAKLLYDYGFNPSDVTFLQTAFGFLIAVVVTALFRPRALRLSWRRWPFYAAYGLSSIVLIPLFYYQSFSLTSIGTATILLNAAPIFVILLARAIYREPLTWRKLVALALAIVGCALVVGLYRPGGLLADPAGILFGLGAALAYAVFNLLGKKAGPDLHPLTNSVYLIGFGLLFLLPFAPAAVQPLAQAPLQAWLLLMWLAGGATLLAYTVYPIGLRYVEVGRASLVATIEPVIASALAFAVLGEVLEPLQILGGGLVIGAAILAGPLGASTEQLVAESGAK